MKKTVRNNTIHLITLESTVLGKYETKTVEITKEELIRFKKKISVIRADSEAYESQPLINILNDSIINDYLERSKRTVLNSIEEDKGKFSDNDLILLNEFEVNHKGRKEVLDKIKNIKNQRGG